MGDRGHNIYGPKRGGADVPPSRRAGTPSNTVAWAEVYFRTKCRLHPSSRLIGRNRHEPKTGTVPLLGGSCDPI